ncbi:hypothetical protein ANN_17533 [Periplaneta americana]|uniref:Uncharacterized protein n=1 Tax=Periplaneta americana TaxID=6978 RepID=A0ABQ8SU80_PERAM|nr:hypothetical protein ANN_17533 [Periplaneta americana]
MTSSCAFKCWVTAATLRSKPEIDWKKYEEGMSVTMLQILFKSYGAMYATPESHNYFMPPTPNGSEEAMLQEKETDDGRRKSHYEPPHWQEITRMIKNKMGRPLE